MNCADCGKPAVCTVHPEYVIVFALCWDCVKKRFIEGKGFMGSHDVETKDLWDKLIIDSSGR